MAAPLPRLRADLDIMPSPLREQPGLIIRDPFRFSEVTLLIPPLLARCLGCFDGEQDEGDLRRDARAPVRAGRRRRTSRAGWCVAARRRVPGRRSLRRAARRARAGVRGAGASARRRTRAAATRPRAPALTETLRGYFNGAARPAAKKRQREGQGERATACSASPRRTSAPRAAAPATRPPTARCRKRIDARRSDLRRARDLALRRARSLRADAQAVRDAVRDRADGDRAGRRAVQGGGRRA